jgi:signal-transduction protein with cAMP-binding, CBS, and nucleotidyltransferase domain
LGQHIADIMNSAGIPYCTGGVMANTATWCKSLTDWTKTVRGWISRGSAKDVLHVDIFFDYHCVYGAQHLADTLQKQIIRIVRGQLDFLKLLASNIQSQHAGISFWGGFVTENGRFNVKRNLLLPITESLRVLSVSRSISIRNSVERAEQLMAKGNIPPEIILLAEDLQFCIKLVLRQQINDISKGLAPTTLIDLGALSSREKKTLKSVQGRVKHLEQLLFDCLFG